MNRPEIVEGAPHILVVEDDQSLSDWICDYLMMHGYLVTVANLQSYMGSDHPLGQIDPSTVPAFAKLGFEDVSIIDVEANADIDAVKSALRS